MCSGTGEVTITVKSGVVTDVAGLPDGMTYKINDEDATDAGEPTKDAPA